MTAETADRILRKPEVSDRVGLSTTAIYLMERRGDFPKRFRIGARAVGWRESEIEAWISSRSA